jgi:hypothetical protein
MDYDLAKQLKEAGFPQGEWVVGDKFWSDGDIRFTKPFVWTMLPFESKGKFYIFNSEIKSILNYIPTLLELIEACGEGFRQLVRHSEYNTKREEMGLPKIGRVWTAKAGQWAGGFITNGFTPEEAVAKLWLKLNV